MKPVNLHPQQHASTSQSQACATRANRWERCSDIDLQSANAFIYSIQAGRKGKSAYQVRRVAPCSPSTSTTLHPTNTKSCLIAPSQIESQ
jgi:hypothetical protein